MRRTLISNPPYNMKWSLPPFAQLQARFCDFGLPPESNANYAFVLTALNQSEKCVLILPNGVLNTENAKEVYIRKMLVEKNYIDAVIICPDNMFEATSIPTCILLLNKNKSTTYVEMIDMRQKYEVEIREQKGQYGGTSHTKRTYKKEVKVFTEEIMNDALNCISERKNISGYCKAVTIEDIKKQNYILSPSRYIELKEVNNIHREYVDIVKDINRIIMEKNACKLTINETLAKTLGFDLQLYKAEPQDNELNDLLKSLGADKIEKQNYFIASKNKNEIKFENNSKDVLSSVLVMILNTWKQHIFYLNQEENRYLAELRDALLPDLMSGKIELNGNLINKQN